MSMIQGKFKDYYFSKIEKIISDYELASVYFDPESIHNIRVEIKKLRAFHNLIGLVNPSYNPKKNLKKTRKLFKAMGNIRDVHVQMELVMNFSRGKALQLSEYYNYLKEKELKARKALRRFLSVFSIGYLRSSWKNTETRLKNLDRAYVKYKTEQRLSSLVGKLLALNGSRNLGEIELHKVRILSKETRYALEILVYVFPCPDFYKSFNQDLRNLHRPLGKFHDAQIGLAMLDRFINKHAYQPFFDGDSYWQFSRALSEESKTMRDNFEKNWNGFKKLLRLHDFAKPVMFPN